MLIAKASSHPCDIDIGIYFLVTCEALLPFGHKNISPRIEFF